jgi:superfamily II DNA or RNA helicase
LPWRTPLLELPPLVALDFLASSPTEFSSYFRYDDSLLFWREATKLLLELLARGSFLPGMLRTPERWLSHWHLLPAEAVDHERLAILAGSMPPICRSVQFGDNNLPQDAPSVILEDFLSVGADALIRFFLRRNNFLEGIKTERLAARQRIAAAWLYSLTAPSAALSAPEYELAAFETKLQNWASPLLRSSPKHRIQSGFRLIAPTSGTSPSESWLLEFLLYSVTDRSLTLHASELWDTNLGFLQRADYSQEQLEDQLLRALGTACSLFSPIRRALDEAHPARLELSTEEAYLFLSDAAKRIEQAGFIVQLPKWWHTPTAQLGLHLEVSSAEVPGEELVNFGFLGLHQLLDYSWQVVIGDRKLSIQEFRELAKKNVPLVQLDGQWLALKPEKLQQTLSFLDREGQKKRQTRLADILRLRLGLDHDPHLLPVLGFTASGWLRRFLERDEENIPLLKEPEGFCGSLRPYQRTGLSWLALLSAVGVGGCLADDMGLGKTIQLLALLAHEKQGAVEQNLPPEPTLLLVPMSIIANWQIESARFTPSLRVYIHHGSSRLDGKNFIKEAQNSDLVVTTYSLAYRDENLLSAIAWRRIALDEAQNIKNLDTKQTQAVRRLARLEHREDESPTPSIHRLALTGTPLENRLGELWSIFDFLNPGFLGSVDDFRKRFALPIERFRNKQAASDLSSLISPFVLRRLKSDPNIISDLPEKIEMDVFTSLTAEQAALYEQTLERMLTSVDAATGIHRKGLVLATITRLKQICNHPVLFLKDQTPLTSRSGKLERIEELLDVILAEGDKVLIFTQFAQMGHLLKPYLTERFEREVLYLHGGLPKQARDQIVSRFSEPLGPSIFILSLKAGGFGLNLTQANQVIHFDQWWNPAVEQQATDRAYRIGQQRTVQVRRFICRGTLEEKIRAMSQHKRDLADSVVGTSKNELMQLSTAELRALLRLTSEYSEQT